jgi:hypothetical protein
MTIYDYPHPPLPPAPAPKKRLGILIAALVGLAVLAAGVFAQQHITSAPPPPAEHKTTSVTASPAAESGMPTPYSQPDYNRADYQPISDHALALLLKDPDANKGYRLILHGVVTQADAATGTQSFRASVAGDTHGYAWQYDTNALIMAAAPSIIADVVKDDRLTMYVDIVGSYSYDTIMGGKITAPVFRVSMLERES